MKHFIFLIGFLITFRALAKCPEWFANDPTVPLCPGTGYLDESYPAGAHIISEFDRYEGYARRAQNAQDRLKNPNLVGDDRKEWEWELRRQSKVGPEMSRAPVLEMVRKILVYSGNQTPLLFLNVANSTRELITKEIESMDVSQKKKTQFLESLRWISPKTARPFAWYQDRIQSFTDGKTSRVEMRATPTDDRMTNDDVEKVMNTISKECELFTVGKNLNPVRSSHPNAEMGGNIETLPGNLCMRGSNQSYAYARQYCTPENEIVIPTEWLKIGHVDEIFNVTKKSNSCDYVVSVPSYRKASELLNGADSSPIFDFSYLPGETKLNREEKRQNRVERSGLSFNNNDLYSPSLGFCNWFKEYVSNGQIDLRKQKEPKNDHSPRGDLALTSSSVESQRDCADAKIGHLKKYLDQSKLHEANVEIQQILDEATQTLTSRLKKAIPENCTVSVVEIPQVFEKRGEGTTGEKAAKKLKGQFSGFFPNAINSIQTANMLLVPNTHNQILNRYIYSEYEKHRIPISFLDTFDNLHAHDGGAHCNTNSLRICRPKKEQKENHHD